jgi:hypothetical protein
MNTKRTEQWTPVDLDTWGGTIQSAPKPVKAHRLVAEKFKISSQFSIRRAKENMKDKARKSRRTGKSNWKRKIFRCLNWE